MNWGRGWEVGVRKAIYDHERARQRAAGILADEHGTHHEPGTRIDLCPKCQEMHRIRPCCEDELVTKPRRHESDFTMTCSTCGTRIRNCVLGGGWEVVRVTSGGAQK